jgi:hypothetical protein
MWMSLSVRGLNAKRCLDTFAFATSLNDDVFSRPRPAEIVRMLSFQIPIIAMIPNLTTGPCDT